MVKANELKMPCKIVFVKKSLTPALSKGRGDKKVLKSSPLERI